MPVKKLSEKCGVVGIYNPLGQVASSTFFSLFALQHRGQESAGIASTDGSNAGGSPTGQARPGDGNGTAGNVRNDNRGSSANQLADIGRE